MVGMPYLHDVGDLLQVSQASVLDNIVAGGSGNNVAVNGTTIDRMDPNTGSLAGSTKLSLLWSASLSAAATLSLNSVSVQTSPDGTTWTTLTTYFTSPGVIATGAGAVAGVTSFNVDLINAYRYVRLNYTPVLSAANTDTASIWAAAIKGGFDRLVA